MGWTVAHAKAGIGIVAMVTAFALTPADTALGIHPAVCGKPVSLPVAAASATGAVAARQDPYRVVATYRYRGSKKPEDKRVMRHGTSAWGYTHIRERRKWSAYETFLVVGCVLTYGKPVSRQGKAYIFRYTFPELPGKFEGQTFEVIYETSNGPKGVITAYRAADA